MASISPPPSATAATPSARSRTASAEPETVAGDTRTQATASSFDTMLLEMLVGDTIAVMPLSPGTPTSDSQSTPRSLSENDDSPLDPAGLLLSTPIAIGFPQVAIASAGQACATTATALSEAVAKGSLATAIPQAVVPKLTAVSENISAASDAQVSGDEPSPTRPVESFLQSAGPAPASHGTTPNFSLESAAVSKIEPLPAFPAIGTASPASETKKAGPASSGGDPGQSPPVPGNVLLGTSGYAAERIAAAKTAITTPVSAGGWGQNLGEKIVWMAGQNHQVAHLHLNPPELGPLEITLSMDRDVASAQFVSAHAQVREAVEAAVPRLREMLADSGISLGTVDVGAQSFGEGPRSRQGGREPGADSFERNASGEAGGSSVATPAPRQSPLYVRRGLVDTFA